MRRRLADHPSSLADHIVADGGRLVPRGGTLDLLRGVRPELLKATQLPFGFVGAVIGVALLTWLQAWMLAHEFTLLEREPRKLRLPYSKAPSAPAEESIAHKVVIRLSDASTEGAPRLNVVIGQRVATDWFDASQELRRIALGPGGRDYEVLLVPDDNALHAWVAEALSDLVALGFRSVRLCTKDPQRAVE